MKYKYIVWDWNGTVLDDLKINFDIINILLSRRGLRKISGKEEYLREFSFPIIGFYEKLGFDLEKEKFSDIAREYAELYDSLYPSAEIFPDVKNFLVKAKESGVNQLIISQTEQGYLNKQVTYFEIDHLFTDIIGNSNIFAGGKNSIAAAWLEKEGALPEEVLFIGDTVHDKEVADSIGAKCALISRGHNSYERLIEKAAEVFCGIDEIKDEILS